MASELGSEPASGLGWGVVVMGVNEIRKDFAGRDQDTFEVLLDTFNDRRNGFVFTTNAAGAKADTQIANEGRDVNPNWDAVWWVAARRTSEGWSAEFRIPFKTLRFESGEGRTWGINFARRVRRKDEISYWSPVSRAFTIYRASAEGNLAGLPALQPGRNLRVKPFVLGRGVRGVGEDSFDRDAKAGVDVKLGVTPSLTLDVTVNPDFAQAEADELNELMALTRRAEMVLTEAYAPHGLNVGVNLGRAAGAGVVLAWKGVAWVSTGPKISPLKIQTLTPITP